MTDLTKNGYIWHLKVTKSKVMNQSKLIRKRVDRLRKYMNKADVQAVIIPSSDPHGSEYVPVFWKIREWISGFNGSAGTAVVTLDKAALWTDSRYFLQAEEQLKGTGFRLMKEKMAETPDIISWLGETLNEGDTVGIDPILNRRTDADLWGETLNSKYGISLTHIPSEWWNELWTDRPSLPIEKVVVHPFELCGENCSDKLTRIRETIGKCALVVSALDDIAWTLNLRSADVHCNPVAVSYLIITPTDATIFALREKFSSQVEKYFFSNGVKILPYESFYDELERCDSFPLLLPENCNAEIAERSRRHPDCRFVPSPIPMMKMIKNEIEIEGFRRSMVRDGVAMVRFLRWLEEKTSKNEEVTELSADRELTRQRSLQAMFRDISFDTIAGYGPHGAIVHYEPTPESDIRLEPKGLLLLDSGAQYSDGTTDITRTIPLGPLTEAERRDYTLVLKGNIALSRIRFPQGTCGTQLDVLARQFMWNEGINYLHGTGHGVGSFLNVHEGPHQIRMNHVPTPLQPGMTITNEPGIYRAGSHGVRIENMMLVTPCKETEFGIFYQFEVLTLCPIATSPIIIEMMTSEERHWLNDYHRKVYDSLAPHLDKAESEWLKEKTKSI